MFQWREPYLVSFRCWDVQVPGHIHSVCFFKMYFFFVSNWWVEPFSTDLYSLFVCCTVTPLSQVRWRVGFPLTCLTPLHSINVCACSMSGACNSVVDVLIYIFVFRFIFVHKLCRWVSRLNCFTFVISGPFKADYVVWTLLIVESRTSTYNFCVIYSPVKSCLIANHTTSFFSYQ